MAEWRSRMAVGAAMVILAPLSARLAVSGGSEGKGQQGGGRSAHATFAPRSPVKGSSDAASPAADLTDPRVARSVSGEETRQEFRGTLCDFLVLYAGSRTIEMKALAKEPAKPLKHGRADAQGRQGAEGDSRSNRSSSNRAELNGHEAGPAVCTDPASGSVEAMIAIVPDPVRTHLALRFDRAVDDLENSAQQLGWRFHKAWLPWSDTADGPPDRWQDRFIDEEMEEQREAEPGLLLFRADDAKKPLVVLVVGDTPTSGVNAEQFRKAIGIWRSLSTAAYPPPCETEPCSSAAVEKRLMILGPTFSGSAPSLKQLLSAALASGEAFKECGTERTEVVLSSGTVTSAAEVEELQELEGRCASLVDVKPVSFGVDIRYVRAHLLRFLDDRLRKDNGIAELTEQESQFGAQAGENATTAAKNLQEQQQVLAQFEKQLGQNKADLAALDQVDKSRPLTATEAAAKQKLIEDRRSLEGDRNNLRRMIFRQQNFVYFMEGFFDKSSKPLAHRNDLFNGRTDLMSYKAPRPSGRPYLHFSFPRGISLLRKAYEQNGILGFSKSSGDAPKTQLQLDFQEVSSNGDAVTSFSGTQGASSMESRMAQLAATLEKDKVSVAVLSATDVLDTIFVARYLRAHAPSVTLVIEDADLLFLRGGDVSLDGDYVVSPYPLIPRNGVWSTDSESPLDAAASLAESQGDEGTLKAAGYLLCGGEWNDSVSAAGADHCGWKTRTGFRSKYLWMSEYEPPFSVGDDWDNDYKLQPPLWLSVIGHGGFQPISLVDVDQRTEAAPESSALLLPRLGAVAPLANGMETPVGGTHPAGITDESTLQLYVVFLVLVLIMAVHAWACTRCRLDRSFAWTYAAADEKPWLTRLTVQIALNLLGIYVLSLLLIHDVPGALVLEGLEFKAALAVVQLGVVALNGVVAWRSAAGGTAKGTHWRLSATEVQHRHLAVVIATLLVSAGFTVIADFCLWRVFGPGTGTQAERNFFWYRSAFLLDGACPTLPLLLLLGALCLWLRGRLSKLVFYGYRIPRLPSVGVGFRCPCDDWVKDLNKLLGQPLWRWEERKSAVHWWHQKPVFNSLKLKIACLSATAVAAVLSTTQQVGPHSLAFTRFDLLIDALAFMVAVATVHNLVVSIVAWHMLKAECLMPLKQSSLRWGFNWIRGFSWKRLWTSPESFTAEAELEYVMRNVEADHRGSPARSGTTPVIQAYEDLVATYQSHDRTLKQCSRLGRAAESAQWAERLASLCRTLYHALAWEADRRLERLQEVWTADFGPVTGPDTGRGLHMGRKPEEIENQEEQKNALQRMADEEFVALVYVTYIRSVLVQIRNRIGTSAGLYILLLWALTGYPWMNRHGILLQMSALLGLLAVVSITIYSQMQKDDILSRTTETATGKLDGEFFSKILSVVGVPLLTLIASQFPEFSNAIFSWLMPGLSSVK